ncbi:MAG: hypothetical protein A4S17_01415 [Proteobacteria bacterium HN_bin10]|nr:MAG: hypothetical protein A4S17_01415 [Proteobacteria bacterium HN_bin10]
MSRAGQEQDLGDLVLVRACAEDLDLLLQIEQESFAGQRAWTRKMFEAELTGNRFSRIVVAVQERRDETSRTSGEPGSRRCVGYGCYWVVFEELRVMNVAVIPAMRRRGIGRRLVEQALADGRAQGAHKALLEVRAANEGAIRLYEQAGFRQVGVRRAYYDKPVDDAILMEKQPL